MSNNTKTEEEAQLPEPVKEGVSAIVSQVSEKISDENADVIKVRIPPKSEFEEMNLVAEQIANYGVNEVTYPDVYTQCKEHHLCFYTARSLDHMEDVDEEDLTEPQVI